MLQYLRNPKTKKKIYTALAVIIIPSFFIGGLFLSQSDDQDGVGHKRSLPLATLGSDKISIQQYLASYKAVQHQAILFYGPQFESLRSIVNFKGEAWDRLLLLDYAKNEKIRTSDREVVDWLASQPLFTSRGRFDNRAYKEFVERSMRTSTRNFEEEARQILTIAKIREQLRSRIHFTDDQLKEIYVKEHEGKSDDKAFAADKEAFRQKTIDTKTAKEMRALLEKLRVTLKVDVESMKKIFGAEEDKKQESVVSIQ